MFKINYRIVDDIQELRTISSKGFDEEWNQVSGLIQICFGEHQEGSYYHHRPLKDDEIGDELLDYWFDKLLSVIISLDTISDYVAFKEIETVNRWLEFQRQEDTICIRVAVDDRCINNDLLILENGDFSYIQPSDFKMSYRHFRQKVLEVTSQFMIELKKLNIELVKTDMFKNLNGKFNQIIR